MRHQHPAARRILRRTLSARQVPRVANHQLEELLVVDPRRDVVVVRDKLVQSHLRAAVLVPRRDELLQHVVFRQRPREHLWVLRRVVRHLNVLKGNTPVEVLVEALVRLPHQLQAPVVHPAPHTRHKLRDRHLSGAVAVEVPEHNVGLLAHQPQPVEGHALHDFLLRELAVPVLVQHREAAPDATEALAPAPRQDEGAHLVDEHRLLVLRRQRLAVPARGAACVLVRRAAEGGLRLAAPLVEGLVHEVRVLQGLVPGEDRVALVDDVHHGPLVGGERVVDAHVRVRLGGDGRALLVELAFLVAQQQGAARGEGEVRLLLVPVAHEGPHAVAVLADALRAALVAPRQVPPLLRLVERALQALADPFFKVFAHLRLLPLCTHTVLAMKYRYCSF
eukprot:Rhum_TRINITY_DN4417_c0_g1::Rhum_TRINITY_DN4417_c0_g1_i1::g.14304::m.14304